MGDGSANKRIIVELLKDSTADPQNSKRVFDNVSGIAFNQIGCVVVMKGEEAVGMFPLHAVAGVYDDPAGPNPVKLISGVLA